MQWIPMTHLNLRPRKMLSDFSQKICRPFQCIIAFSIKAFAAHCNININLKVKLLFIFQDKKTDIFLYLMNFWREMQSIYDQINCLLCVLFGSVNWYKYLTQCFKIMSTVLNVPGSKHTRSLCGTSSICPPNSESLTFLKLRIQCREKGNLCHNFMA